MWGYRGEVWEERRCDSTFLMLVKWGCPEREGTDTGACVKKQMDHREGEERKWIRQMLGKFWVLRPDSGQDPKVQGRTV